MTPVITLKRCTVCDEEKSVEEFHRNALCRDGLQSRCKTCACAARRRSYENNKEASHAKTRAWRAANPEKVRRIEYAHRLKKQYGITLEEYEERLEAQGGTCAICHATEPGRGRHWFPVDHDHETGEIRGLLCMQCNDGLGRFRDNPDLLATAIRYLIGGDL